MAIFSAYNDDGITITVMASSEEEAVEKTAKKIAEIGLEIELNYFEDDINDSYVSDDETVEEWLKNHGADFNESNMLIMEYNDVEQNVNVYEL